jgi:aminoglycoside N3'-acetyltransferase
MPEMPAKRQKVVVTKDDIKAGLLDLGLKRGDHAVVHSSLSSLGHVEGGAEAVIVALEEALTPDGTLVMATYSGGLIYFLEALALKRGVNGQGGTGHGVVFAGAARELWEQLRGVSEEASIHYPFDTPGALWERFIRERPRIMRPNGWDIEFEGPALEDSSIVRVVRRAPPLPAEEVKPWRMPAWTGKIPDTFWRRPETMRSQQYSGSFTAWGKLAEKIVEGHDNTPGARLEDHPLYKMKEAGGKVLLLGVDHGVNSAIHIAEWIAVRDCGVELPESWNEFLGDFQSVDGPLDESGGQMKGRVGSAEARLADTRILFELVAERLREKIRQELCRG